jgi:hypothetical protein
VQKARSEIAPDLLEKSIDRERNSERLHALAIGVLEALT